MFSGFLLLVNRDVYAITWKNVLQPERQRMMTVRGMHFVYWITETADTRSEYVILIACPLQQYLDERTSVLHYGTLNLLFILPTAVMFLGFSFLN
jgi:hypothetical protein